MFKLKYKIKSRCTLIIMYLISVIKIYYIEYLDYALEKFHKCDYKFKA